MKWKEKMNKKEKNEELYKKLISQHEEFSNKLHDQMCEYVLSFEGNYPKDAGVVFSSLGSVFIDFFLISLAQHIASLPMRKENVLKLLEEIKCDLEDKVNLTLDERDKFHERARNEKEGS